MLESTHECELDIPQLPPAARKGHIIPGMKGHSLISLVQLCNAGCQIAITREALIVYYQGQEIMRGLKCNRTGLWLLPLTTKPLQQPISTDAPTNVAANVYQTSSRAEWIQYLHQACFSPNVDTWCKAIDNDQFMGWPGLTSKAVRKYLPPSTATAKGHMARNRKNVRSTTKPPRKVGKRVLIEAANSMEINLSNDEDFNPAAEPNAQCDIYIGATIGDTFDDVIYSDQTGRFPVRSFAGNEYVFTAYVYGPNAILARAMRNRSDEEMIRVFKEVYEYLESKGFKPKFHVTDNECSQRIKRYLQSQGATHQAVPADAHGANAAERAVQTFKNHFIAGLATVDPQCPIQLWDEFIEQAQNTLNMLRTSRVNPKLSAYEILEGPYNFNKVPLAPPGTKAIVYIDPKNRTTWGVHGEDAFYVGPAPGHYRCYKFFIVGTKAYRIAQAAQFYPAHCKMPAVAPGDTIRMAAQDLIHALKNPHPNAPVNLEPVHNQALRDLASIFDQTVTDNKHTSEGEQSTITPSTSHDTTAPRVLRTKPRVHQRITRRNTPFLPTIEEEASKAPPKRNKTSTKHDARAARRQARAKVREQEEAAINDAIKQNAKQRR